MMQLVRLSFFGFVTLTLFALAYVYLERRLVVGWVRSSAARWGVRGLALAFLAVAVASRAWAARQGTEALRPLVLAASVWMGLLLYLLFTVLCVELPLRALRRPGPVSPARRELLARALVGGATGAAGAIAGYGVWRAFQPPLLTELPVALPRLPRALDGFTLVQLTDVHLGGILQERFIDALVDQVNQLRPDAVVLTGDLVDGPVATLGRYVARLARLRTRHGTFFVTGNHDYYSGVQPWCAALESMGITVLRNRHLPVGETGASFDLVGVDDWGAERRGYGPGYDLEAALRGRAADRAAVLLAHRPEGFEQAAARGIGLQLSGHTHGGQMFPGTWVAQAMWGDASRGLSTHGDASLYVSRGCGFVGPAMRVGSPPELVRVSLLSSI